MLYYLKLIYTGSLFGSQKCWFHSPTLLLWSCSLQRNSSLWLPKNWITQTSLPTWQCPGLAVQSFGAWQQPHDLPWRTRPSCRKDLQQACFFQNYLIMPVRSDQRRDRCGKQPAKGLPEEWNQFLENLGVHSIPQGWLAIHFENHSWYLYRI